MPPEKLSALEKIDYIYRYLNGESGYNENKAKQYAIEVGKDLDNYQATHLGAPQCPEGDTIPF